MSVINAVSKFLTKRVPKARPNCEFVLFCGNESRGKFGFTIGQSTVTLDVCDRCASFYKTGAGLEVTGSNVRFIPVKP